MSAVPRLGRVALVLAAVLGAACITLPRQPVPTPEEGAWAAIRERLTRSGKLYDGLATNAFARAVYQRRDLREARVARMAVWKAYSVEETERELVAERDAAARYEEFLVFLFTPTPADNDLDSRTSVWRLALVVPGSPDALPERVEQIRADTMLRSLYPDIGDFDVVYRVRFPRHSALADRSFVFRLAGAVGRIDMQY